MKQQTIMSALKKISKLYGNEEVYVLLKLNGDTAQVIATNRYLIQTNHPEPSDYVG